MKMNANVRILGQLKPQDFSWQPRVSTIIDPTVDYPGTGLPPAFTFSGGERIIVTATLTANNGNWGGDNEAAAAGDIIELINGVWTNVFDATAANQALGAMVYNDASLGGSTADPVGLYQHDSGTWSIFESADEKSKVSSNDTVSKYLEDAITVSQGSNTTNILEASTLFDGFDEDFQIQIDQEKIDHDVLLNFVPNEHIDHSAVSITAGLGLSGGGDITDTRTIDLDLSELTAETIESGDFIPFEDTTDNGSHKITVANLNAAMSGSSLSDSANIAFLNVSSPITALWTFNSVLPTSTVAPENSTDLTTKAYVDNAIGGLSWKEAVEAASTGDVALTGGATLSIDGVTMVNGYRVLLKDQSTTAENGIYEVSGIGATYSLDRTSDMNSDAEAEAAAVFVKQGATHDNKGFVCTAENVNLGTTSLPFVEFFGGAALSGGAGIETISSGVINVGDAGKGVQVNANDLEIDASEIAGDGLKVGVASYLLDINVPDFAGTGLEDDGSNNLRLSSQGNGIAGGGAGGALSVQADTASITTTEANAISVGANGVSVKVDDSTIEGSNAGGTGAESLRVRDNGISAAKLADLSEGQVFAGNASNETAATDINSVSGNRSTSGTLTSGTATATINHAWGTKNIMVEVYDSVTFETIIPDVIDRQDDNNVRVDLAVNADNNLTILLREV
jgi:hypothetical protein